MMEAQTEVIKKPHHKTIPLKPSTFEKLDGLRRDLPAAKGTKKETWDDLINRLVAVWDKTGIC